MANIKSAKKRIRVIDKKTARNRRVKGHLKAILKAYDAALEAGDMETAKELSLIHILNRLSRIPVPDDCCFSLIGDTDGIDIFICSIDL